jgi:hypothetical protein
LNNKKQTSTQSFSEGKKTPYFLGSSSFSAINAVMSKAKPSQTIEFPRTIKINQAASNPISKIKNVPIVIKLPDAVRITPIKVASKKPVAKPVIDPLKEEEESSAKYVQVTNLQLVPTATLNLQNDPLKIEIKVEDTLSISDCEMIEEYLEADEEIVENMPLQETPSVPKDFEDAIVSIHLEKIVEPLTTTETIEIEFDKEEPEIKQQNKSTKAPKLSKLKQEIINMKQEKVKNNLLETLRAKWELKPRKFGQESRVKKLREHFLKPIFKPTEKSLFCDKCDFHCVDKEILVRHITVWHIPDPEVEKILCKFCESTFTTKDKLIFHQNNKHPDMNKFTCGICYSNYSSLELLREHRRTQKCVRIKPRYPKTARTKVVCPQCCGLYLQIQITRHIAKIHDRERNFVCAVSFNFLLSEHALFLNSELQNHVRDYHTNRGEKLFSCDRCNQRCYTRKNIRSHIVSIHLPKKYKHRCVLCGKGFKDNKGIRKHMTFTHRYDKVDDGFKVNVKTNNFHCTYCDHQFKCKYQAIQHQLKYHE